MIFKRLERVAVRAVLVTVAADVFVSSTSEWRFLDDCPSSRGDRPRGPPDARPRTPPAPVPHGSAGAPPPPSRTGGPAAPAPDESVEFNLYTNDENGGYIISVPRDSVAKLRQVVADGGLYGFDAVDVGNLMIDRSRDSHLTKDGFNAMIRSMVPEASLTMESRHRIADLLGSIFFVFDRERNARVNVYEWSKRRGDLM